jgi:acyl dehydratase
MTTLQFPSHFLHFEDLVIGETRPFGMRRVSQEEIVRFAQSFDPQPMHLDDEAARNTIVGGLCASGFHTCAMFMRMMCDGYLLQSASLGSPGVDEVRWLKPVRPGDTLTGRFTPLEKRVLASRPGVGISKMTFDLLNADGQPVLTMLTNQLMALRQPGAPVAPVRGTDKAPAKAAIPSLWDAVDAPVASRTANFFEDRMIGEIAELGQHTFGKDEIIDFAREFDPQPFHLDEEAGRKSLFGGLSASGWHTASILIRQIVAYRQAVEAEMRAAGLPIAVWGPSPGFKDCRWLKPVMAGDTISYRNRTSGLIPSKSKPERGLLVSESQGRNQHGDVVFLITNQVLVQRKTQT